MILMTIKTTRRSFKISDNHDLLNDNDMCSFEEHEAENVCFNKDAVAYRVRDITPKERYLKILEFTQFFDHFVFTTNAENVLEKELKKKNPVSVGIELVVVDM